MTARESAPESARFEAWWKEYWVNSPTISPSVDARRGARDAWNAALRSEPATSQRNAVLEEAWRAVAKLNVDTEDEQKVIQRAVDAIRALKERAAPQEPTNTTASPVSDSPTPAAAALQNPYAGKNPRCAKGCPPETWCAYDECPGRKK